MWSRKHERTTVVFAIVRGMEPGSKADYKGTL